MRSLKISGAEFLAGTVIPGLLSHASDGNLILLTRVLEKSMTNDHYRLQMQQLRELFQAKHPALELGRRVFNLHPNVRRAIINGLGIHATWLGDQKRKAFAEREGVYPPFLMVISPIMRCNLRCLGCYAGEYPRGKDPLSFEVLDRIVTEAKEMGTHFITVSGGEPFMRPDLLDLYEKHQDCVFLVYTNGTRIDERVTARLQKIGNVAPAISVEGFEEETDFRRGKGVWLQVMAAMNRLHQAGVFFGFSATATRLNADVYLKDEFYDLMIEKGCLFGWFFIFVPVGKDSSVELMVTPEQRDRLRAKTADVRRTRPLFVADFWNDGCLTGGCMSGGRLYLHVNYRGDLEPCVFMHFATENILDVYDRGGHLADVLKTPFFQAVRDVNRRDSNLLRPCPIIDHNEWFEEAIVRGGAKPTHEGAEEVVGRLAPGIRKWAAEYTSLAERAWQSKEYQWFRDRQVPIAEDRHAKLGVK